METNGCFPRIIFCNKIVSLTGFTFPPPSSASCEIQFMSLTLEYLPETLIIFHWEILMTVEVF